MLPMGMSLPITSHFTVGTYFCYRFWIFCTSFFRYPNLKSVKELIYKRGYGKLNKQRIPLTDNSIVEQVWLLLFLFFYKVNFYNVWKVNVNWHNSCIFWWTGSWETWYHLCWRSYSRDSHCWPSFQGSQQLPLAIQVEGSIGRHEEKEEPLCWRRRCRQPWRFHQRAHQANELEYLVIQSNGFDAAFWNY